MSKVICNRDSRGNIVKTSRALLEGEPGHGLVSPNAGGVDHAQRLKDSHDCVVVADVPLNAKVGKAFN